MLLRSWLLWLCMLLLLGAVIEASSAVFLRFVFPSTAQFLLWKPDLDEVRAAWSADLGRWDDELGWPSPQEMISPPRDPTGAKLNSDFPKTGDACASAYGDSFVWGDDIPLADGWVEALSRNLGCRVANYGVSGYGTDQAYLRFRRNTRDEAPIVLLGIFPENVMRNVNQYRAFLGFSLHPYWLKGRFALDGSGHLDWIPRPRIDAADFIRLHTEPARVVPREYLLPDSKDGPVTMRFPYALALGRVALARRLRTRLTGQPSWSHFYAADHESGALALTTAIAEAFDREAARREKRRLTVMLPGASSFRARASFGAPEYAPLVEALEKRGVDVFDPSAALIAALGSRSYCDLYFLPADCAGHFGRFGSKMMAGVVATELRRRGWVR